MKIMSNGDAMMNNIIGSEAPRLMKTTVNEISSHFKTNTKYTVSTTSTVITETTESNHSTVSPVHTVSTESIQNTMNMVSTECLQNTMNTVSTEYSIHSILNTRNKVSIEGAYNKVNTFSTNGITDQASPITSNLIPAKEKVQDFRDMQSKEAVHILAVDDNLIDRRFLEKLLRTSSYKVTIVDSAIRALEILGMAVSINANSTTCAAASHSSSHVNNEQGFKFNLIITDYCMPGMTGYDLLKTIKGSSALKEIPVIVMSSENVPTRVNSCLAEGAEEFLLKPLQLADVKRLRCHVRHSGYVQTNYCNKIRNSNPVE